MVSGILKDMTVRAIRFALVLVLCFSFFSFESFLFAQEIQEPQDSAKEVLENRIKEVSQHIESVDAEIDTYRNQLESVRQEQIGLQQILNTMGAEEEELEAKITLTKNQILESTLTLQEIRDLTDEAETSIASHRYLLGEYIRDINRLEKMSAVEQLAGAKDAGSVFRQMSDLQKMLGSLEDSLDEVRWFRHGLREKRREFQTEQEELDELRQQILDQRRILAAQKKAQEELIAETKEEQEAFEKLLAEREALRKAFEQELFEYESQLKFILDPKVLPRPGSAPLSWPLDKVLITQMFGVKTGPHRIYKHGHSGVDFRGNGDPVYAMADGVIQGVGDTDVVCPAVSFGKWVFAKFDNNLAATYGHLSLISVRPGQRVKRGQLIGYSGNTGRSTAPHLHVTVYAAIDGEGNQVVQVEGRESRTCRGKILVQPRAPRNAYLDPLDYLPLTTKQMYKPGVLDD